MNVIFILFTFLDSGYTLDIRKFIPSPTLCEKYICIKCHIEGKENCTLYVHSTLANIKLVFMHKCTPLLLLLTSHIQLALQKKFLILIQKFVKSHICIISKVLYQQLSDWHFFANI